MAPASASPTTRRALCGLGKGSAFQERCRLDPGLSRELRAPGLGSGRRRPEESRPLRPGCWPRPQCQPLCPQSPSPDFLFVPQSPWKGKHFVPGLHWRGPKPRKGKPPPQSHTPDRVRGRDPGQLPTHCPGASWGSTGHRSSPALPLPAEPGFMALGLHLLLPAQQLPSCPGQRLPGPQVT